ncbi:hypothetical protein GCM10007421_04160 [Halopseudomonas oceani]|nr:hypothetical protein GCM10007421_04160 [Halopseudomonas oceani]
MDVVAKGGDSAAGLAANRPVIDSTAPHISLARTSGICNHRHLISENRDRSQNAHLTPNQ